MDLQTGTPLTVLYRGDLYDTAALVGLAKMKASVGVIAFIGELTNETKAYIEQLNKWLSRNGLPEVSIHPKFTGSEIEKIIDRPHRAWGWQEAECLAALRLSEIPLPPSHKSS